MARDELFRSDAWEAEAGGFRFNEPVAEVFDDMLYRSVPFCRQVIVMTARLLESVLLPGDRVYDLGCATGTTLLELNRQLAGLAGLKFVGLDNSPAMIAKAVRKAGQYANTDRLRFEEQDIIGAEIEGAGAVILNYTLQFLRPEIRPDTVRKIHSGLRPGGVLIMSEKVRASSPLLDERFVALHHDFKREQGYSELEIAKKREALENVLIPLSIARNRTMLEEAGFVDVETFFQWFNFVSFVAVKGNCSGG